MTDIYPRLSYAERIPSTIPNLPDGGWEDKTAAKVYLELCASSFDVKLVANLNALFEAKVSRANYLVRYGDPKEPHILEVQPDLRRFLHTIGPDGSPLFEGIREDTEAYKPHHIAWPSIVFAGRDLDNHREELEDKYPGTVIVADEDARDSCPTFTEFQQSLARSFEHHEHG